MPGAPPRRAPGQRLPTGRAGHKPIKPVARPARTNNCCDSPNIEIVDGSKICVNCGTQISESNIVAEVTFGETSTGAATVQGGFVGETARHARTLGAAAGRRLGSGFQSREETEQNGRQELRQLAPLLHVPQNVEDIAFNLWKLASAVNFIQGRRTSEVAGACLLAACRRDKDHAIMMIDISEALQVNVFKFGAVYSDLCKELYLEAFSHIKPVIEIEPLLMKYCLKLEFGDKTRQVAEDAAKIVKRMKRDWIVSGRHPAGLCGACIVLAARMNNFRRTVREVVYVVKVADMTIATRLAEFKRTHSSTMTVEDFRKRGLQLKHQHNPPSFNAADERIRKREEQKRKRLAREETRRTIDISDDESDTESRMSSLSPSPLPESAIATAQREPEQAPTNKQSKAASTNKTATKRKATDPTEAAAPTKKQKASKAKATSAPTSAPGELRRDADGFLIPDIPIDPALTQGDNTAQSESAQSRTSASPAPTTEPSKKRKKAKKQKKPQIVLTDEDFAAENALQEEIEDILEQPDCVSTRNDIERTQLEERAKILAEQQRSLAATLAAKPASKIPDTEIIGEDEFDNDPEMAAIFMSEDAIRVKERIWVKHNEDWMRAQQQKHLKRALAEAEGGDNNKRPTKRRKRSRMGDGTVLTESGTPINTPGDAAIAMLEKRAPKTNGSKGVNYAALNRIMRKTNQGTPSGSEGSPAGSPPAEEGAAALPTPPATQAVGAGQASSPPQGGEPTTNGQVADKAPANGAGDEEGGEEEEEEEEDDDDEGDVFGGAEEYDEDDDDYDRAIGDLTGDFTGYGDDEEVD